MGLAAPVASHPPGDLKDEFEGGGGQEMSPHFCTRKVAASLSTSPPLDQVRKATIFFFGIAYRPLRVLIWPRKHFQRPSGMSGGASWFPLVCIYLQANTFPMPMCNGTLYIRAALDGACQAA